jgi:hypothetical protein
VGKGDTMMNLNQKSVTDEPQQLLGWEKNDYSHCKVPGWDICEVYILSKWITDFWTIRISFGNLSQ